MNFPELVRTRQSVRAYLDKPVEPEKIDRCIEAARLSPSACNSQPWKFIVINKPDLKNRIAIETFSKAVSFNHFSLQAPVLIAIVGEKPTFWAKIGAIIKQRNFKLMDIGIAAEHFCLQAAEEGIGTCMLGWFNTRKVGRLLNIPKMKRAELIITVGYAKNDQILAKNRKTTDEIRSFNGYNSY